MSCCPDCAQTGGSCVDAGMGTHIHDRSQYNVLTGYGLRGHNAGFGFALPEGVEPPPQAEYANGSQVTLDFPYYGGPGITVPQAPTLVTSRPTSAGAPVYATTNGQVVNTAQNTLGIDQLPEIPGLLWVGLGVVGIALLMRRRR